MSRQQGKSMFENFDRMRTIERELYHIFWAPEPYVTCLIGSILLGRCWLRSFPSLTERSTESSCRTRRG